MADTSRPAGVRATPAQDGTLFARLSARWLAALRRPMPPPEPRRAVPVNGSPAETPR